MNAADAAEAAREKEHAVLHVALAPAAVAFGVVNHRLGGFLVAAGKLVGEPDLGVGLGEEGGFDEIVAEDVAAEGLFSGELGKIAPTHKGFGADDRIVAPVVGKSLGPEVQAAEKDGGVKAIGELLKASEEGFGVDERGSGLDEAGAGMSFHEAHQLDECRAGHDAVGVKYNEVAIAAAPGFKEVADVAAFLAFVVEAAAVVDAAERADTEGEFLPLAFFFDPFLGRVGVAKNEEIEIFERAGGAERFVGGAEAFADASDFLVKNGKSESDADVVRDGKRLGGGIGAVEAAEDKTKDGVPEAKRREEEQNGEADQNDCARGGPAGAPKKIGKKNGDGASEERRERVKGENAPGALSGTKRLKLLLGHRRCV